MPPILYSELSRRVQLPSLESMAYIELDPPLFLRVIAANCIPFQGCQASEGPCNAFIKSLDCSGHPVNVIAEFDQPGHEHVRTGAGSMILPILLLSEHNLCRHATISCMPMHVRPHLVRALLLTAVFLCLIWCFNTLL